MAKKKIKVGTKHGLNIVAVIVKSALLHETNQFEIAYREDLETPEGETVSMGQQIYHLSISDKPEVKYSQGEIIEPAKLDKNGKEIKPEVVAIGDEVKKAAETEFSQIDLKLNGILSGILENYIKPKN